MRRACSILAFLVSQVTPVSADCPALPPAETCITWPQAMLDTFKAARVDPSCYKTEAASEVDRSWRRCLGENPAVLGLLSSKDMVSLRRLLAAWLSAADQRGETVHRFEVDTTPPGTKSAKHFTSVNYDLLGLCAELQKFTALYTRGGKPGAAHSPEEYYATLFRRGAEDTRGGDSAVVLQKLISQGPVYLEQLRQASPVHAYLDGLADQKGATTVSELFEMSKLVTFATSGRSGTAALQSYLTRLPSTQYRTREPLGYVQAIAAFHRAGYFQATDLAVPGLTSIAIHEELARLLAAIPAP